MKNAGRLNAAVCTLALASALAPAATRAAEAPSAEQASAPVSRAELQQLLHARQTALAAGCNAIGYPDGPPKSAYARLVFWNGVALDTIALDETPPAAGCTYTDHAQFGPTRASRALAIFSIAEFEAVNALTGHYVSYAGIPAYTGEASIDAAIAQAGHDALVALFPTQKPRLDALLQLDMKYIHGAENTRSNGRALGTSAATAMMTLRAGDGSQVPEPKIGAGCTLGSGPGAYQMDPVSQNTTCLGYFWGQVKPFVLQSASQFLPPAPPALTSTAWVQAFNQIKTIGGDPSHGTPTLRTRAQTVHGIFWTYDAVPELCAPPRMYNQVLLALAATYPDKVDTLPKLARYFAVANTGLADAAISAWYAKWLYQFWRPITAIRAADQGNAGLTTQDRNWTPLGSQATDEFHVRNFTPPFPAYPSGHATFGGALFETLRAYFGNKSPFTFVSDEYNGLNYNDLGQLQPYLPQTFATLSEAEYQNSESRIWIGVHWQFDGDQGIILGNKVADYVMANAFLPVPKP